MRLKVRTLRQAVKGDLPIEFVPQYLTSYGGLNSSDATSGNWSWSFGCGPRSPRSRVTTAARAWRCW